MPDGRHHVGNPGAIKSEWVGVFVGIRTYICMRLMEGADIYQIAKNCRTSVEMIEKHYAIHLKNTLDAAAINVIKRKAKVKARKLPAPDFGDD
jgi:hypothetical protein